MNKKEEFNKLLSSFRDVYYEYFQIFNSKKKPQQEQIINPKELRIDFSTIHNNDLILFYEKITIFFDILKTIQNNYILIQGLLDNKYNDLIQIKYFLIHLKSKKSRSFHDKIFNNILKMTTCAATHLGLSESSELTKHVPLGVTRIFGDFVKGITFFSEQVEHKESIPIYHRAASCGDSTNDFRKKFLRCYGDNSYEIIKDKKEHIYRCYLERLIFDNMFIQAFKHHQGNVPIQQNKGHKFQLTERGRNFNSCFLGIKIDIKIEYKNNYPIILYVYFRDANNNIIKSEEFKRILHYDDIYERWYYDEDVFYTRNDENGTYTDIQEFSPKIYTLEELNDLSELNNLI